MRDIVPVLIIGYQRSDFLKKRIEECLLLKSRVYVFVDRANPASPSYDGNVKTIEIANKYANCVYRTKISETNLGLKNGVIAAIDWFFEFEEQGIILEDDIEIDANFFSYASYSLERFKNNLQISSISASKFQTGLSEKNNQCLSLFGSSWGWATWQDRWQEFRSSMRSFPKQIVCSKQSSFDLSTRLFWQLVFYDTFQRRIETWDYIWFWHNICLRKFALVPPVNLAINHGFHLEATNTKFDQVPIWLENRIHSLPVNSEFLSVEHGVDLDKWISREVHGVNTLNLLKHFFKRPFHYLFDFIRIRI